MIIYFYDRKTGEYTNQATACIDLEKSRLANELVYIIPENATMKKPLRCKQNQCCVFLNGRWKVVEDHRGKKFFDTEKLCTVTITKLDTLPKSYVELNSSEYKEYLRKVDPNTIRNSLKDKIQELYEAELNQDILIGTHYFKLAQLGEFKNIEENVNIKKEELQTKITQIQKSVDKEEDMELKNELIKKQLSLYKEIDSIKIQINVKTKMNTDINIPCTYEEFNEIHTILRDKKEKLENEKMRATTKLSLAPDSELVLFEQKLRSRGLAGNGKTRNEAIAERHIKTS